MGAEKKAAIAAIDEILRTHGKDLDILRDGPVLVNWVIVGSAATPKEDSTGYFAVFSGGTLPTHTIIGLLEVQKHRTLVEGWADE